MIIIEPHELPANIVFENDIPRVKRDAVQMIQLARKPLGLYPFAYAIAHTQVEEKQPLAFFVVASGKVIMNPKIRRHVNYTNTKSEGCYSYADKEQVDVQRWPKIEVSYETFNGGEVVLVEEQLRGIEAEIFQHEVDHLRGIDIFHKPL